MGVGIRPLKRRLGKSASPEVLTPSFRTGVVAEPVLQDTDTTTAGTTLGLEIGNEGKVGIRPLKRRLGKGTSPEGLVPVLQDGRSSRAGPSGHGYDGSDNSRN